MKYYALKTTFKYSRHYICNNCRNGKYNNRTYYASEEPKFCSIYNKDEKFTVTETIYYSINDIKQFMKEYDDHINPDMTFKDSFPKYDELEKMAVGKYIDETVTCDNSSCKNGEYVPPSRIAAELNYESECIIMVLIEDRKRQFIEDN